MAVASAMKSTALIGRFDDTVNRHQFIRFPTIRPAMCDQCQTRIWGLAARAYKCKNCGLVVHEDCVTRSNASSTCSTMIPQSKSFRAERLRTLKPRDDVILEIIQSEERLQLHWNSMRHGSTTTSLNIRQVVADHEPSKTSPRAPDMSNSKNRRCLQVSNRRRGHNVCPKAIMSTADFLRNRRAPPPRKPSARARSSWPAGSGALHRRAEHPCSALTRRGKRLDRSPARPRTLDISAIRIMSVAVLSC